VLGTFGSSVGSLFTFARWLFFLNVLLFVVWLLLVLIPQSIHFDYSTVTASFSFMDLVNGMVPTLTHPPHHTGHTPHTPFTASLPRSASWTLSTAWYQHSHTLHTPFTHPSHPHTPVTPLTHPSHPSHTLHTVTASFSVMDLVNGVVLTLTHPPHHTRHTRHTPSTPHSHTLTHPSFTGINGMVPTLTIHTTPVTHVTHPPHHTVTPLTHPSFSVMDLINGMVPTLTHLTNKQSTRRHQTSPAVLLAPVSHFEFTPYWRHLCLADYR